MSMFSSKLLDNEGTSEVSFAGFKGEPVGSVPVPRRFFAAVAINSALTRALFKRVWLVLEPNCYVVRRNRNQIVMLWLNIDVKCKNQHTL